MNYATKMIILMFIAVSIIAGGCTVEEPEQNVTDENLSSLYEPLPEDEPEESEAEIVEVSIRNNAITPEDTTVSAGNVRFEVANERNFYEEFAIEGEGVSYEIENGIPAGETRILEVDLESGTYNMYSPIPGREALGLSATLTVE